MINISKWTAKEDEILTSATQMKEAWALLSHRSKKSVEVRMRLLANDECTILAMQIGFHWNCAHATDVAAACVGIPSGEGRRSMDVVDPALLALIPNGG